MTDPVHNNGSSTPTEGTSSSARASMRLRGNTVVFQDNGFVFQGCSLFPHLTALQNITLPLLEAHGMAGTQPEQLALELLHRLGLAGHEHKRPAKLSGGHQ